MTPRLPPVGALLILTAGWGFVGTSWPLHATGRTAGPPVEHLTAKAVSLTKAGLPPTSVEIEISIDRWSTDAERDRLVDTLKGKGSRALIEQLRSLPSIGYIGTSTSRGWGLRFAQTRALDDGGRQVIIATDRPMSFTDTRTRRRQTIDYPFSLIDIRFDRSGTGVGKLAFASNLTHNTKTGTIEIDNYGGEPVRLTGVRSTQGQAPAPPHEQAELAKQLSNPVSSLVSVPFQFNWEQNVGPSELTRFVLNVQPVIPFAVNDRVNLIVRLIAPLVSQPPLVDGGSATFGLSDITTSFFVSPSKSTRLTWGIGPVIVLPSTSESTLGSGKWSAGPTMVALKQAGPWTVGALWNQTWSFSGDRTRPDVSQMFLQPFLSYQATHTITLSLNSEMTANWHADDDDDRWTIPINMVFAKLATFGAFPASYQLGFGAFAAHPRVGPSWKIRAAIVILLPRAKR